MYRSCYDNLDISLRKIWLCFCLRPKLVSAPLSRSWYSQEKPSHESSAPDVRYHCSCSQHCGMMSSQITVRALWILASRVARAAASSGLTSGGFISSYSSSHPLTTHQPTRPHSLSSFPSPSRFSTAGCCSQAASWRLDVWLPRWLRTLPQDPRVNQEVVTSLRGELLPFSTLHVNWWVLCKSMCRCAPSEVMRCHMNNMNKCSVMVRRKCDPAFRVRQRDTAPVKAAKLTVLPMNLYCVRVNPTVIVDHVNYSVCQCSWSHHADSKWQTSTCLSRLSVAHKSWAEWTSPSRAHWVTFQLKVLCSTPSWVDCLYLSLNRQDLLSGAHTKDTTAVCWPYYTVRCYIPPPSRSDQKLWLFSHVSWINIRDSNTTSLVQHVSLGHVDAMSWFQPHILNSSPSLAPSGVFLENYKSCFKPPLNDMDVMSRHLFFFSCVLIAVCGVPSVSAEMYYHLLTWTKTMPYLKPPTIILQTRDSHRRHPLPWYMLTHPPTDTTLTHYLCKENTQIQTNIRVRLLPCDCIGCLSDSHHDVTTTYCHMQSCETVVTVRTGVKLDLMLTSGLGMRVRSCARAEINILC